MSFFKMSFKNFLKRFQVEYLVNVLRAAFTRFPLSVICAACGTVLWLLTIYESKVFSDDMFARLLLFVGNGLVLFTSAKLFAESHALPPARRWGLMAACAAVVAGFAFLPAHFSAANLFFAAAISLSMLFAPYIGRRSTEDSVWYYNYSNGVSFIMSGLSTLILCLGLCAILGSVDYLFELNVPGKLYGDIWIVGFGFFGPVMFMSYLQRQFDFAREECQMMPGIHFIANYLVVPLVLIMTWVLYAYFAKIVYKWELPRGNLAYMVTGFGAAGVAARLAVFPMRDNGTRLLQQFYKYFYYLLLVPVGLLGFGLYTRISQYGVTEERYAIGLSFLWLAGLCAFSLLRPKLAHIKQVPMVLSALFLLATFGPWGAVPVSTNSQVARLESLLTRAEVLNGDKLQKTAAKVSFDDRKEISSILDYIYGDNKEASIAKLTAPFEKEITASNTVHGDNMCENRSFTGCRSEYDLPERVMAAWGMKYVQRWGSEEDEYYTISRPGAYSYQVDALVHVAPYEYYARITPATTGSDWVYATDSENGNAQNAPMGGAAATTAALGVTSRPSLVYTMNKAGLLTVRNAKTAASVSFQLQPLAQKLYSDHLTEVPVARLPELDLTAESGHLRAKVQVLSLSGHVKDGVFAFDYASLALLVSP
ncbi:MAG: DUF4153 domain-containing protein [Micavibrio sp.]|nr:DUF4153 domain-containing protein [Micavibrio sp.]